MRTISEYEYDGKSRVTAYTCGMAGATGGAISGGMAILNLRAMKSVKNVAVKLAVWLAMLIATLGICFVLGIVFLSALM